MKLSEPLSNLLSDTDNDQPRSHIEATRSPMARGQNANSDTTEQIAATRPTAYFFRGK